MSGLFVNSEVVFLSHFRGLIYRGNVFDSSLVRSKASSRLLKGYN